MKKQDYSPIGDVLKNILKGDAFRQKLAETKVLEQWTELVGETIAKHTKKLFVKNGKLFVQVDSPMLKSDLTMKREVLKKQLNELAGMDVVSEVVLL